MDTNKSSMNGLGFVGPDDFETWEIMAVETDLIARTEQTETFKDAKKQISTSYDEQNPESLHKSGSSGVRKEIKVAALES